MLLVVIDSVNFHGGAHGAAWLMIDALVARGWKVDVLTGETPRDEMRRRLASCEIHVLEEAFPRKGLRFWVQGCCRRLRLGWVPNWTIDPTGKWRRTIAAYETVLVIGENSHLRNLVGSVEGPKKVVFIHTDYVAWRRATSSNRRDARCDVWTYRHYDVIGVVGRSNADRFAKFFPQFKDKVRSFHNLFHMTGRDGVLCRHGKTFRIVSFSRLNWGPPKETNLSVRVAAKLKAMGLSFDWTIYGDGEVEEVARLKDYAQRLGVENCFHMPGYASHAEAEISTADVVTLFSAYEGLSNAIYEALLCGTPVIATNVGGASEQIQDGKTGRLVAVDADEIAATLADVIQHRDILDVWRGNLVGYAYDNEKVISEYLEILS